MLLGETTLPFPFPYLYVHNIFLNFYHCCHFSPFYFIIFYVFFSLSFHFETLSFLSYFSTSSFLFPFVLFFHIYFPGFIHIFFVVSHVTKISAFPFFVYFLLSFSFIISFYFFPHFSSLSFILEASRKANALLLFY